MQEEWALTLAKSLPFYVRKSIIKYKEQQASANSCILLLFRKGSELYSTSSESAEVAFFRSLAEQKVVVAVQKSTISPGLTF